MSWDTEPDVEKGSKAKPKASSNMTLQKAVDLGEYDPEFLATFAEWHTLSPHVQLQFIRQGLDNRRKQLLSQWAEINNAIDFRLKPELAEAMENIYKMLSKLEDDREKIYSDYSRKMLK